jgi:hypothetical protein
MEKFNRAERRHQVKRIKAKRKQYWGLDFRGWSDPMSPVQLGAVARTPHPCSCIMGCGNERAFYGKTIAEICNEITLKEELQDLDL